MKFITATVVSLVLLFGAASSVQAQAVHLPVPSAGEFFVGPDHVGKYNVDAAGGGDVEVNVFNPALPDYTLKPKLLFGIIKYYCILENGVVVGGMVVTKGKRVGDLQLYDWVILGSGIRGTFVQVLP